MTIEQAIDQYLLWKDSHTTTASKQYKVRLSSFMSHFGNNRELKEISGNDIVQYHNTMASSYSLNTVAYSARILKNFFDFWRGRGKTTLNPKEIIPIRFVKRLKQAVTEDDVEDMTDLLDKRVFSDLTKKVIISLLWDTGMRVSELCDLTLSDINEKNVQGVRTAYTRSRKSLRYNLIAWSKTTDDLLTMYLGVRLCKYPHTDYLFVSPKLKNTKLTTRTIQRWIKELANMAMIDKEITPHSFRHGKAHNMLDRGATMRDVQAILRHANPVSSFHYVGVNETKLTEIASQYLV